MHALFFVGVSRDTTAVSRRRDAVLSSVVGVAAVLDVDSGVLCYSITCFFSGPRGGVERSRLAEYAFFFALRR